MSSAHNQGPDIGYYDEGAGEAVVLLHASAASRRQWKRLREEIGGRYRLIALDLHGYGETRFPQDENGLPLQGGFRIEHEVALGEHVLARVDGPFHLVGHSYGGAVALHTALRHPARVQSVFVHEPVLFHLLRLEGCEKEWREIESLGNLVAERVEGGREEDAARAFVEYWSGPGAWDEIPRKRRPNMAAAARKAVLDFEALFALQNPLADYRDLGVPARLMAGNRGPRTARRVAGLLGSAFGERSFTIIDGVGHMAPVTHPERVNPYIIRHLARFSQLSPCRPNIESLH